MNGRKAVEWMAKRGRVGYANKIAALEIKLNGYSTAAARAAVEAEIAEVEAAALDRYEDWASDPLP